MSSKTSSKPKANPMSTQTKDNEMGDNSNVSEVTELRKRLEEHESRHLKIKTEFESLRQLNEEIGLRHDKEVKELKLDLRIAKRDADKWNDTNRFLRDEKRQLRDQLVAGQSALEELRDALKAKDEQIEQLMLQLKTLHNDFEAKQLEQKSITDSYKQRMNGLENDSKALREQLKNEMKWKVRYEESNRKSEHNAHELQSLRNQLQTLQKELGSKNHEIELKDKELKKLRNNTKVLQTQCLEMDKQLEQFKSKYVGLGAQKERLIADKDCTVSKVQRLDKELETIRNNLKSVLKEKEEMYRKLESEQYQCQNLVDNEKQRLRDLQLAFEKECQKNREYEERLSVQEQNLYSNDETIITLDSKVSHLEEELIAIKEEAAKHITTIGNLKDSNHKLTNAFEQSIEKVDELQIRIDSLHHQLDVKEGEMNREKITAQETVGQHLKLIDFLQNKVEALEKQKKPLFSITPTKSKPQKIVTNSSRLNSPIDLRDLDKALAEERTKSRRLAEELNRLKRDANYCKTEVKNSIKCEDLSENSEPNVKFRKPLLCDNKNRVNKRRDNELQTKSDNWSDGLQRMRHNIPHRFAEITNKVPNNKCVSCAEVIHFGRKAMKCSECSATTHHKCAKRLPNNCGLPVQLMQQLFHSCNDVNDNQFDDYYQSQDERQTLEVHPIEPSAPEETFTKYDDNSDSSATTDNNESPFDPDLNEIQDIYDDKENGFSFTDSMIESLERDHK